MVDLWAMYRAEREAGLRRGAAVASVAMRAGVTQGEVVAALRCPTPRGEADRVARRERLAAQRAARRADR